MKNKKKNNISERVKEIISMQSSDTDPFGSYTGVPLDPNETPTRDVDDF